jgi:hypothetical protein
LINGGDRSEGLAGLLERNQDALEAANGMVEKSIDNLKTIRAENLAAEERESADRDNQRLAEGQAQVASLIERRTLVDAELEEVTARRADSKSER